MAALGRLVGMFEVRPAPLPEAPSSPLPFHLQAL
jgi:hypothetical protein